MDPLSRSATTQADDRAEIIFFQALKRSAEEREPFLNEQCGEDARLRAEVEGLLRDSEKAGSFLSVDAPASPELEAEFSRLTPEQVGERIGNYKLFEQIGEGGFGTVWVAEQERPMRRRVALKIIKLGMDTREVIARFEQERQALAMMDHPNIAKVLDAGATPFGRPFFVMELVRGIKITEYCDQANLPTVERLRLFLAVCQAVQHAHQKGIIHRDLKPSNILVTLHDGVPVPKVIDFGVAKATQQQRLTDLTVYTQFEQMVGTPLYMSPEQAEMSGLDIDTRSDIYSLGVLLYELLVGRTPFDPEELMKRGLDEIRRAVREQEPQKPSTFVSTMALDLRTNLAQRRQTDSHKLIGQIRGDLDWIVMKALEKDRARRYETASSLAHDIQRHMLCEPVEARPPTQLYRFRRFARRNKVVFVASAAVAAALLAGAGVSTWQAFRARHEAERAHHESDRANSALSQLRASAPAFAAMSRSLVAKERFEEAIEKLDVAINLRPDVAAYSLSKADLLQSQLRFDEAAPIYREALRLDTRNARAETNAVLCEQLASEVAAQTKPSRNTLAKLFGVMTREQRPPAEMMRLAKLLGEENKLLLSYWLERLKDLPIPPGRPLEGRLIVEESGGLALDLSSTDIVDLTPLEGMPLERLDLSYCMQLRDLSPLRGMPLRSLRLRGTEILELSPLQDLKALTNLVLTATRIRDISALRGLPLKTLDLHGTLVTDLTPLGGMPLEQLNLRQTPVAALGPLRGAPLKNLNLDSTRVMDLTSLAGMLLTELDCTSIPASDFSPLAGAPLEALSLDDTHVGSLSFLRKMPLRMLRLDFCFEVTHFETLSALKTLEVLTLPFLDQVLAEDFRAIGALRDHPALKQIEEHPPGGGLPVTAEAKEQFWPKYDSKVRTIETAALAEQLARQGKFAEAAKLLRDGTISPALEYWLLLGALYLASGDQAGYRAVCKETMQRFRARASGDECSVRLSLLSPDSGVPMAELRALVPHMGLIRNDTPYLGYYLVTNGLLEYRDGHYAEAIDLLRKVNGEIFPWTGAAANVVLSMAFFRRGEFQTAKTALERARDAIAATWLNEHAKLRQGFEWFYTYLLFQEAEQLVAGSGSSSGAK